MKTFFGALLLLCAVLTPPAYAATLTEDIQDDLQSPQLVTDITAGERLRFAEFLAEYYATRGDTPGWVTSSGPLPAADQMLEAIRQSAVDGLHPEDYHLQALESLFAALGVADLSAIRRLRCLAAIDLLLSDAFLLLGEHERNGRANPAQLDVLTTAELYEQDLVQSLQAMMGGVLPQQVIRDLAPRDSEYIALRQALARYRELQSKGGLPEVAAGPVLRLGSADPRVAALIAHLVASGDLQQDKASATAFGPEVEEGVRRFQQRHSLNSTGVVDAPTLAVLNEPIATWIDRLRVNMERRRWLPQQLESTRVMVNIAGFRAALYIDDKVVLLESVVVGKPYRQTPEFSNRIQYLVLNPSWDVPPDIASAEILPAVQQDPGYLDRHHYQTLQGWGPAEHLVDTHTIDWKQWTAETLPYHFRQLPGPENALGRVKFIFPNWYGIYLHDTPAQGLFTEQQRTFSHGCIRLAHAMDLAEALLRLDGRADPPKILQEALASGQTQQLDLTNPVPIYIVYLTAWVDGAGVVRFHPDVYGRDSEVLQALDAPLP